MSPTGRLVLVATPIGNLDDMSARARDVLCQADVICCEDTRHTGRLLKHFGIEAKRLLSLHEHNEQARTTELLSLLEDQKMIAIVSDAGMPLISDPGEQVVRAAIAKGIQITVVPGPFAGVAAIALSGFSTKRWRFEGFLPRKGAERVERLRGIATAICPSVVYESPHRIRTTLLDLVRVCGPEREVAIARELTKLHEEVVRSPLGIAVDHRAVADPRGEFVLIIDGVDEDGTEDEVDVDDALVRLVDAGLAARDAVAAVEILLKVPHRRVYEASLRLKQRPVAVAQKASPVTKESVV